MILKRIEAIELFGTHVIEEAARLYRVPLGDLVPFPDTIGCQNLV
jgi:hypothetical protein